MEAPKVGALGKALRDGAMISPDDMELLHLTDDVDEASAWTASDEKRFELARNHSRRDGGRGDTGDR